MLSLILIFPGPFGNGAEALLQTKRELIDVQRQRIGQLEARLEKAYAESTIRDPQLLGDPPSGQVWRIGTKSGKLYVDSVPQIIFTYGKSESP
jgi:hypothetical protein